MSNICNTNEKGFYLLDQYGICEGGKDSNGKPLSSECPRGQSQTYDPLVRCFASKSDCNDCAGKPPPSGNCPGLFDIENIDYDSACREAGVNRSCDNGCQNMGNIIGGIGCCENPGGENVPCDNPGCTTGRKPKKHKSSNKPCHPANNKILCPKGESCRPNNNSLNGYSCIKSQAPRPQPSHKLLGGGKGPIGTYKSRNTQFITFWIAIGLFVILFMTSLTMKNKLAKPAAIFFTFGFAIAAVFLGLSAWGILPKQSSKN